ncbi:hypothetical protein J3Q64DRAFT_1672323 [Phycomyces blakesleeanus]|uniref:Uncharacterized protein n=2 Tax=Phycomyces blakesleeanus TaxID=4837 RepID=A0A162UXR9_PHYB8|nr:hypothetical protein PHYBLDRAFT_163775 [Phycomyces blakesleeanus NRRL 1555(-)]OAD78682.1 hypothetical protein PHYBLDRAFT_163775 [Phycomyces blakesleeanus NRRL 1555(-)]|eukprot:XP_018296722.1 hypothetical protein PHYBLDRAFT_163775 [Phycomyces blakesleeanus NRRL 1555(-)]
MYNNWSKRANIVSSFLHWYKIESIVDYLQSLRDYIIHPGDDHKNIKAIPTLVRTECPVGTESRFPEDGLFVCQGYGKWGLKIDIIQIFVDTIVHPKRLERSYWNLSSQGQSEEILLSLIDDLFQIIEQMSDVVDRASFEKRYGLQWVDL